MPQFYARYVPQNASEPLASENQSFASKRPAHPISKRESKKRKIGNAQDGIISTINQSNGTSNSPSEIGGEKVKSSKNKKHKESWKSKHSAPNVAHTAHAGDEDDTAQRQLEVDNDEDVNQRHSKVLSRFSQSKDRAAHHPQPKASHAETAVGSDIDEGNTSIVHDLKPIPQPQPVPVSHQSPKYSTAPDWLREPVSINGNTRHAFSELGLAKVLVENLRGQGKETTLPIQSAVLPLLLGKPVEKRPDLCVAAATGSGKTFAYVLPILHDLQARKIVRLRAVVVVPTRSLVKQVVQAIEMCSVAVDLRLGTAEGSKTLAEEQRQLIQGMQVYDPIKYRKQQMTPIDWSAFSLEEITDQAATTDFLSNIGYVTEYVSKIDVLVCTPGRLVEHLQKTKGFSLDDVQWFVVDEADRLLDESYHEWLETVLPALKSQRATEQRDKLLRYMYVDVPSRRVTKLLLSATMTNDISRLLALELKQPRLVVVEDTRPETEALNLDHDRTDGDAQFKLPPRLEENAIALKDTENKPLYLVELLTMHIFGQNSDLATESESVVNGIRQKVSSAGNLDPQSSGSSVVNDDESADSSDPSDSSSTESDSDSSSRSSLSSSASMSSDSDSASISKGLAASYSVISTKRQSSAYRPRVLIFTKSTEAAHRLSRLLSLLLPDLSTLIATFTRSSSSSSTIPGAASNKSTKSLLRTRSEILQSFHKGTSCILISTDLAARGLDIPQLAHVINYDVPSSALAYVHRVGRTARAGMQGHAWTLVEHKQGKWFWETIGGKNAAEAEKKVVGRGDRPLQKVNVMVDKERWMDLYEEALQKLGEDVRRQ